MQQFEDAKSLIKHSRDELSKLRIIYDSSLEGKHVGSDLLIQVKNLCENLRSSLDILATGIYFKYCRYSDGEKIYFPYAAFDTDISKFKKKLNTTFPGLSESRPDLHAYLISVQHFGSDRFKWLPVFMGLNNENKHQRLVPQLRRERVELHIKGAEGQVGLVMEEGAIMDLAPGSHVNIAGAKLQGGQTVSTSQMPIIEGGSAEIVKWASFHFESNNQPVLPFLSNAVSGIHEIVDKLSS